MMLKPSTLLGAMLAAWELASSGVRFEHVVVTTCGTGVFLVVSLRNMVDVRCPLALGLWKF